MITGVLRQAIDEVLRQAQRLSDIPNCRAWAIGDRNGGNSRPIPPVFFVNVLQHLFTAFMLEINVDVRRLVTFSTDEPLEQHVDSFGIDGRNAQTIADGGIGSRSSSLA